MEIIEGFLIGCLAGCVVVLLFNEIVEMVKGK